MSIHELIAARVAKEGSGGVQSREELLADALRSWKSWPDDMKLHLADAGVGAPLPSNASGTIKRLQAEALLFELKTHQRPAPMLWRGCAGGQPKGVNGWTSRRAVASLFAKRSRGGGEIYELPAGMIHGLRIADIITSEVDETEEEWVVLT